MKKQRILFVVDNGRIQSGAVVRAYQFREALAARADVSAEFISHRPVLLARLDAWLGRKRRLRFLLGALRRVSRLASRFREPSIVRKAAACDAVYVLLVPSLRLYRQLARLEKPSLFMDVLDNLWRPTVQRTAWKDFHAMLALADAAICENRFVAAYLRPYKKSIFIVPDSPQVEAFDPWRGRIARSPGLTLGWVGSPTTSAALFAIFEPLERLFAKHPGLHLRLIGADPNRIPRFENVSYSILPHYDQEQMVKEVLAMDIGLFPLFNTEEALMRGALKATVYMSGGAVAVCRDLGESRELIEDGVNGVLAEGPEEWFAKLEHLVLDGDRRRAIAAAGLRTIRERFTREQCLESLLAALRTDLGADSGADRTADGAADRGHES